MFKVSLVLVVTAFAIGASARGPVPGEARPEKARPGEAPTEAGRREALRRAIAPESAARDQLKSQQAIDAMRARLSGAAKVPTNKVGATKVSDAVLGGQTGLTMTKPVSEVVIAAKTREVVESIEGNFKMKVDPVQIRTIVAIEPKLADNIKSATDAIVKSLNECGSLCLRPTDHEVSWAVASMIAFRSDAVRSGAKQMELMNPAEMGDIIVQVAKKIKGADGKEVASTAIAVLAEAFNNGRNHLAANTPGNAFERGLADSFRMRGVENPEGRAKQGRRCGGQG